MWDVRCPTTGFRHNRNTFHVIWFSRIAAAAATYEKSGKKNTESERVLLFKK